MVLSCSLTRFEGIQGLKIFQSLRIPDPGERQCRDIDMILLTKRSISLCFPVMYLLWWGDEDTRAIEFRRGESETETGMAHNC